MELLAAPAGCKNIWQDKECVKKHEIKSTEIVLCLNCDDWISDFRVF